jgi:hypothetical protein
MLAVVDTLIGERFVYKSGIERVSNKATQNDH